MKIKNTSTNQLKKRIAENPQHKEAKWYQDTKAEINRRQREQRARARAASKAKVNADHRQVKKARKAKTKA